MWHDLSQPFYGEMPHSGELPSPEFKTIKNVETDSINVQHYAVPTHIGTHIDAPLHFIDGGKSIDEFPLSKFAGEGVVLDVSVDAAREITMADLEAADGEVRPNDIVFLYTGWYEKYGTDAYDPHPWLAEEVAEYFADIGPDLVGLDVITPDIPVEQRPDGWLEFPVHRTMLAEEVLIAEHLSNLKTFLGQRIDVVGFPVKIQGGDGAPARFAARGNVTDDST